MISNLQPYKGNNCLVNAIYGSSTMAGPLHIYNKYNKHLSNLY